MSGREQVVEILREWVVKAEHDLLAASHLLGLGTEAPTDTICFHAQQCIEKYMKAVLIAEGTDFRKTHDVDILLLQLPRSKRPNLTEAEISTLTDYAVGPRYPGFDDLTIAEARRAVALARRIRRELRRHLPRAAKTPASLQPELRSRHS